LGTISEYHYPGMVKVHGNLVASQS
jgi:hypothetical protein